MLRKIMVASFVLFLGTGILLAEEIKGKVKSVEADKGTITVTVGDKDQTINVAKDAEIYSLGKGKKGQPGPKVPVNGGLGGLNAGSDVTVTVEKKDGKDVATAVKLEGKKKGKN